MKFIRRHFDYSTRMHMKRRARAVDYRFLLAVIGLGLFVLLAMRFL